MADDTMARDTMARDTGTAESRRLPDHPSGSIRLENVSFLYGGGSNPGGRDPEDRNGTDGNADERKADARNAGARGMAANGSGAADTRTASPGAIEADARASDASQPQGVADLSLDVRPGETLLLCGRSGCGKTTVTRLINGLVPHYFRGRLSGRVLVDGFNVTTTPLENLVGHVGSVFQNPANQFFTMTVRDELASACENAGMPPERIRRRMEQVAGAFGVDVLLDSGVDRLSGGQQQVASAAAAMARPGILVLDEPTANLDASAIGRLRGIIALWRDEGRTVVIAEHRLYWLEGLVDRAAIMDSGRITRVMSGRELGALTDEEREGLGLRPTTRSGLERVVRRAGSVARGPRNESSGAWRIDGFSYTYRRAKEPALAIEGAAFPAGRVTVVMGPNGAGKSTFIRCLQGLDRRCHGELVTPDGERLGRRRRLDACFTVLQNVTRELFTADVLDEVMLAQPHEDASEAGAILARLDLAGMAGRHPLSLSGGQRQRVAIAAAVASERPIIIADEPTSGLDLGHMRQVAALLRGIADEGRTVVVVTHDPEFAALCADRTLRIIGGRIVRVQEPDGVSEAMEDSAVANASDSRKWTR